MLKNENIICISSIDWDFIWQGHQEVMSTLASNGNKVLFIENTGVRPPGIKDISRIKNRVKNWFRGIKGIRKEGENLYIFSPLVLPFPYSCFARWINCHLILSTIEKWMKAMDFTNPIIWTFLPTPLTLDIADRMISKFLIYYCIDSFSASSVSASKIKRSEIKLLKNANLVFVTSKELYGYCRKYNDKVYSFPFAVNFEDFEKARLKENTIPDELRIIKPPVIGYVGGVHKWIDQELIKKVAEKHGEFSFVFIGPLQTNVSLLTGLENVYFLGKKDHREIPFFVKHFDVCMIPYLITDYTRNVYPTKMNEYLAMAKPVVSTNLPEVTAFNEEYGDIIYAADDKERFSEQIGRAIRDDGQVLKDRRIAIAKENNWGSRIEKMSALIEKELEIKRLNREGRWKENFIGFYRIARGRVFRWAFVFLTMYLILFKTSFIWFLAEPLRITERPQKADAIVVFGGGVGETGNPGKSTIERARYAAELYGKGYAGKIIFSSGYAYTYNDAENMRLIAISLGVLDKDIILEKKANSAYENVIFSKEILDKFKWGSILLVSSPYNMRRASLVFNKWAGSIGVFYVPVEKSQFYDRMDGTKMEQVRAIMHEYAGIVYYFFKGYI